MTFNPQPKPEKRQKSKRKRIKPLSDKRKKQNAEYKIVRDQYLIENPVCVRCPAKATEVHHANGRRGKRLIDVDYFVEVCRTCHRWIHDNPKEAKENGWFA